MKTTSTVRALAVTAATALTLSAAPALAFAQDSPEITVGEPGSALTAAPEVGASPGTVCGTAYVGEYDIAAMRPYERPTDARAIEGLTVSFIGSQTVTATTDENGRYCLDSALIFGNDTSRFEYDTAAVEAYNAQPGAHELELTFHVGGPEDTEFWSDPNMLLNYLYDPATQQLWKFDIAFSEATPPPEPMGSVESFSLQFLNLPEILRGMLHGGAMGS